MIFNIYHQFMHSWKVLKIDIININFENNVITNSPVCMKSHPYTKIFRQKSIRVYVICVYFCCDLQFT